MKKKWTILVIEDDPQFRMTLSAYLEDSGHTVIEAANGEEGLEMFAAGAPDIVLTDLRMPRLDGYGVIAGVRARSPGTPIIAFTGTGDPSVASSALHLGARACLFKPIQDLSVLETMMEEVLGQQDKDG